LNPPIIEMLGQIFGLLATFVFPILLVFVFAIHVAKRRVESVELEREASLKPDERLPTVEEATERGLPIMEGEEVKSITPKVPRVSDEKPSERKVVRGKNSSEETGGRVLESVLEERLKHVDFSIKLKLRPGKKLELLGEKWETVGDAQLEISTKTAEQPKNNVVPKSKKPMTADEEKSVKGLLTDGETPAWKKELKPKPGSTAENEQANKQEDKGG
jgi:hypothetical protein